MDARRIEPIPEQIAIEKRCIYGRIGISGGDARKNALRAAALIEVVVDERDVQCEAAGLAAAGAASRGKITAIV